MGAIRLEKEMGCVHQPECARERRAREQSGKVAWSARCPRVLCNGGQVTSMLGLGCTA